ncbi:CPBP family intramembrane glutamic endopeptidase [Dictyobacter kobayashii]|uniref:CPBP family intramembrane metalloprotease n=1 Tax=Dictyobacter kobayashii TaxID=2014872 RepID=A0A402ABK3_9CHLR|nr:CPBP family intramembrane glutamic endopeptidase [Dictyobacter kobayashii]GCE16474.1 CPBP family intramembrane metalloprotease [Dictyobacter kobayashii]
MEGTQPSPLPSRHKIIQAYQDSLWSAAKSPASWLFLLLWLTATIYIAIFTNIGIIPYLELAAYMVIISLLTIALTPESNILPSLPTRCSQRQLWLQLAVLLIIILLTGYRGMILQPGVPTSWQLPVIYPILALLHHLPNGLANPLLYFVLPVCCLLPLGASWKELGFEPGYRSWLVTLLWNFLPLILLIIGLLGGAFTFLALIVNVIQNALLNGFFEEFLMRGALMTRLNYLFGTTWSIVLSSLIFGFWHIGVQMVSFDNNFWLGLATTILGQATIGLGLAVILQRTRNLLASSIFHVVLDTASSLKVIP